MECSRACALPKASKLAAWLAAWLQARLIARSALVCCCALSLCNSTCRLTQPPTSTDALPLQHLQALLSTLSHHLACRLLLVTPSSHSSGSLLHILTSQTYVESIGRRFGLATSTQTTSEHVLCLTRSASDSPTTLVLSYRITSDLLLSASVIPETPAARSAKPHPSGSSGLHLLRAFRITSRHQIALALLSAS